MAVISRGPSPLDAPDRVGRWARTRAQQLRYEWALQHWKRLVGLIGMGAVLGVLSLLVPIPGRQFVSGVAFASGGWAAALLVLMMSGTASLSMGHTAEQWTSLDLRRLRRDGWRVAHGVRLRATDIDHVALGAGGLIVVETKWSSDGWATNFAQDRILRAVGQVRRNARDLRLALQWVEPVSAVVVLWGHPRPDEEVRVVDGVTVVPGDAFGDWLTERAVKSGGVTDTDVERAWAVLERHVRRRDRYDQAAEPPPRSLERTVSDVWVGAIAGIVAVTLLGVADMWSFPLSCAAALLA